MTKMEMQYCVSLVGYITIGYILFKLIRTLWILIRCYVLTSIGFTKDLRKYGEWVVVTGATDGIGKQYARQFAKRGFKVVLVSRTIEKLEKVKKEIEDEFKVETQIVCFDFSQPEGYDEIEKIISNLDIGILVNNVGMGVGSKFSLFDTWDINNICKLMNTNMISDVRMTHMVIKGMLARQRGAIIHVASIAMYMDIPFVNVYPATKSFMEKFFKLLQVEYSDVIDQQLVAPGFVSTNMSGVKPMFGCPTAEDYAASAVRTLGIASVTSGYWVHELQTALFPPLTKKMRWHIGNSMQKYVDTYKM